ALRRRQEQNLRRQRGTRTAVWEPGRQIWTGISRPVKIVTEIGTREISRADAMEERTVTEAVREAARTATEERAATEAVREASRAATEERAATEAVREASRAATEEIIATEAVREASRAVTEEIIATEA